MSIRESIPKVFAGRTSGLDEIMGDTISPTNRQVKMIFKKVFQKGVDMTSHIGKLKNMKTIVSDNFKYRVAYAAQCFMRGTRSRNFDNCFEMYDGEAVVVGLMRRAMKNEKLKHAICKNWSELGPMGFPVSWEQSYLKYKDVKDLNNLARSLRSC